MRSTGSPHTRVLRSMSVPVAMHRTVSDSMDGGGRPSLMMLIVASGVMVALLYYFKVRVWRCVQLHWQRR